MVTQLRSWSQAQPLRHLAVSRVSGDTLFGDRVPNPIPQHSLLYPNPNTTITLSYHHHVRDQSTTFFNAILVFEGQDKGRASGKGRKREGEAKEKWPLPGIRGNEFKG